MRQQVLPALSSRARIDIWCAAAATGEEPYSIAFTLLDTFGPGATARCRVLATDISKRALERARRAEYPLERFSSVPAHWLSKYLEKAEGLWRVRPEVGRMVEFRKLNLIEPVSRGTVTAGGFPLIWCRNVMIYFDAQTQQKVVAAMERSLEPGGYLFVGHSESLGALRHGLEYVRPAIYRRPK
jgi:chemotaxis protein methyltransferase CheR